MTQRVGWKLPPLCADLAADVEACPSISLDLSLIRDVVAVHRLREVSCLYGFIRFEAALTSADGDLEDLHLAVRGAPISGGADWLPTIEQFSEGIFIHFYAGAIRCWRARLVKPARLGPQDICACTKARVRSRARTSNRASFFE
jgi:hypothetical protein